MFQLDADWQIYADLDPQLWIQVLLSNSRLKKNNLYALCLDLFLKEQSHEIFIKPFSSIPIESRYL